MKDRCKFGKRTRRELSEDIQKVMRHREPSQTLMEKDTCQCHPSTSPCQYESICKGYVSRILLFERSSLYIAEFQWVKNASS